MAFVEPCCVEHMLPQLLRNSKGNALFQTNGDVTIEKLMQAACCMASGGFGEYWIVVREADIVLMRTLAHWIDRGWIRRLCLLTETDQRTLVASELGTERMKLTDYGWREGLAASQLFCCIGERETIVVQGEMMLQAATTARVTAYSASVGPNSRMLATDSPAASLIDNLRALLRASKRRKRKSSAAQPSGSDTGNAQPSGSDTDVASQSDASAGSDPSDPSDPSDTSAPSSAPSAESSAAPLGSDPDRASQGDAQSASDPQSQSASDPESQSASDPNSEG